MFGVIAVGAAALHVDVSLWYYVILCDTMWYYVILCDTMWYYVILCDTMWYYVILCDTMWYYVILCDIMWYYVILCDIMWYYVILCDIMWYYVILCDIMCNDSCTSPACGFRHKFWRGSLQLLEDRLGKSFIGWPVDPISAVINGM